MRYRISLLAMALTLSTNGHALSPIASEGEALYPACHVCHNPAQNPPLGPPMWGVQRRYKMHVMDDQDFVDRMVEFVKAPSLETALHNNAVEKMGLMPPMPLPDEILKKIAHYILEADFPPPCEHWRIGAEMAEQQGDSEHAQHDRMMIKRFCDKPGAS